MNGIEALLQHAHDLGARFQVTGERVRVEGRGPLPVDLMAQLRKHKAEVQSFLVEHGGEAASFDLPFPIGCGGLPKAQVEAAEAINGRLGISHPVHRKYNVLAWVRGYYQDRGETHGEHYEAIKREQQRLGRILDQEGIGI